MQGRSILSVFGQVARIFFLIAVCSSGVFADTRPTRISLVAEPHQNTTLDTQLTPENKSGAITLPQLGSLAPKLKDRGDGAIRSPEPRANETPDTQDPPENKSGNLALPQLASLTPQPTDHGADAAPSTEPFALPTTTTSLGGIPAMWAELQSRILADEKTLAACSSAGNPCPKAAQRFLSIIELGRQRKGRARLGWINRAVNLSVRATSDWAQYGVIDYWASPLQTFASGAGDCEDYAIAKYVALRHLGIAPDDLRFLIVRDNMHQAVHAIVAVHYEQEWLILDNRTMAMLNTEHSRNYYPLFVMDDQGVRAFSTVTARR
jgi:predicted transglutaminase-like cysteine proteinase